MQLELEQSLEQAQLLEDRGENEQARDIYQHLLESSGKDDSLLLFQWAGFLFRSGEYVAALESYIGCHRAGFMCAEIEEIVLEAYYRPNVGEFAKAYVDNVESLACCSKVNIGSYPDFDALTYCFIPYTENKFAVFDSELKSFLYDVEFGAGASVQFPQDPTVYLMKNQFNIEVIQKCLGVEQDDKTLEYSKMVFPLYLAYENSRVFIEFLQVSPFRSIVQNSRCFFLFGEEQVKDFFAQPEAIFPIQYMNMTSNTDPFFVSIEGRRQQMFKSGNVDYQNLMFFVKKELETRQ